MNPVKNFGPGRPAPNSGSALLIVLGFLSFIMISAVSFAIYMRIEHQASANYRHVTSARHHLETALFRAMEEVDAELRREDSPGGLKFPSLLPGEISGAEQASGSSRNPWGDGRVLVSARSDTDDDDDGGFQAPANAKNQNAGMAGNNARPLSLEGLSFLPASLVNTVRYYALPQTGGKDVSSSQDAFTGAKWRPIRLPRDRSEIGRYAYICVNLSDMLDVNACRADPALLDAASNRVSTAHLFTKNDAADLSDIRYETVRDFYACMDGKNFGNPYYDFIEGSSKAFDPGKLRNHVLVTDSIVKAEPREDGACNLKLVTLNKAWDKGRDTGPQAMGTLLDARAGKGFEIFDDKNKSPDKKIGEVFKDLGFAEWSQQAAAGMIADYLDEDSVPQLNLPSAERAPMLCRLVLAQPFLAWKPTVESRTEPGGDGQKKKTVYSLKFPRLDENVNPERILDAEIIYPFREMWNPEKYSVEIRAFLDILEGGGNDETPSGDSVPPGDGANQLPLELKFKTKNLGNASRIYNYCLPKLENSPGEFSIDFLEESGGAKNWLHKDIWVKIHLLAFVKDEKTKNVVDAAPFPFPGWKSDDDAIGRIQNDCFSRSLEHLYFRTKKLTLGVLEKSLGGGDIPLVWTWRELWVPDARFNHRALNWCRGDAQPKEIEREPGNDGVDEKLKGILGRDGRDHGLYLCVSDAGHFQSPGEWGFIVRPFEKAFYLPPGEEAAPPPSNPEGTKDWAHMFRTFRLYDQGNQKADGIYRRFTYANGNGTLDGYRVNPLSQNAAVLSAAIESVPVNYGWAARLPLKGPGDGNVNTGGSLPDWADGKDKERPFFYAEKDYAGSLSPLRSEGKWNAFTNWWLDRLTVGLKDVRRAVNCRYQYNLYDGYGSMGWYDGLSARLPELSEAERKMLFTYSLDNFSDRQQLFLYFLAAEATVPAFGAMTESATRSVAGGKAVALVWRDPYPYGYTKPKNSALPPSGGSLGGKDGGSWQTGESGSLKLYGPKLNRPSPWFQYKDPNADTPPRVTRYNGFHEQRVLFFKQIEE